MVLHRPFRRSFAAGPRANRPRRHEGGFTLLEVLIVIVVLGILAAVVLFALGGINAKAAVSACQTDVRSVETAVQAYQTQFGSPPATQSDLTSGPNNLLQSWPTSPYYTITMSSGAVSVAAPSAASAQSANASGACSGAGVMSSSTSTTSTSTSTTSTTTTSPSNGVTVVASNIMNGAGGTNGGSDNLQISNTSSITSITVTIVVARTTSAITNPNYSTTYANGAIHHTFAQSNGSLTYTYYLNGSHTIGSGSSAQLGSQYAGDATPHPTTGDTWSVTSTSGGITSTLSGTF